MAGKWEPFDLNGSVFLPLAKLLYVEEPDFGCEGVPEEKRDARFVCVIACAYPDGTVDTATGVIEGKIAHEPKGENGFGYDPIFFLPERGCTTGELPPEEKNEISHRGIAIRKMVDILKKRGTL